MRALIFDRQDLVRLSLKHLIMTHTECEEVLEAKSTSEFVSLATHHDDIDLMIAYPASVNLTTADCVCLAERLLDGADLILFRETLDTDGADYPDVTFLDRHAAAEDVIAALDVHASPAAVAYALPPAPMAASHVCQHLSRRQKQIMAMVAEGLANKEIAARLGIAEGTVKAHIHAVFKALGVTNRTQAVVRYGGELRRA
ncbi:MAG: LuxR family transcriptional regulator [Rhodothalassiaceae bacterium]